MRVPKNGDFLHSDHIVPIYEDFEHHQKNFPDTPPVMSLALVLMNIGTRYSPVECIEQEWSGTIEEVPEGEGDPKCPNGHLLRRGAPLRLSWSQKAHQVEMVDSEDPENPDDNCDVWMRIDFGHGPVEVRCTQTGEHTEHGCAIAFAEG